jgi:hypothetical protein
MTTPRTSALRDRILAASPELETCRDMARAITQELTRPDVLALAIEESAHVLALAIEESARSITRHVAPISQWWEQVSPLRKTALQLAATSEALQAEARRANAEGRREIARLHKNAHRLTRSRAHLAVRVCRLLDQIAAKHEHTLAGYGGVSLPGGAVAVAVASAFNGDELARKLWRDNAHDGDPLGLQVVALLDELDEFSREVSEFLDITAAHLAAECVSSFPFDEQSRGPDIRRSLTGSIHRAAP